MMNSQSLQTARSTPEKSHLLLGLRSGWKAAATTGVRSEPTLRLQALPGSPKPLTSPDGSLGGLALPRAVAVDTADRVYILDSAAGLIKRFDPCTAQFETLPCIGGLGSAPRQLNEPSGLAVSSAGDLYVADTGNRRVQVFASKGFVLRAMWGPLRVVNDAAGICVRAAPRPALPPQAGCAPATGDFPPGTWQPYDIAIAKTGCVLISDYANGLIHVFDRHGRWQTAWTGITPDGAHLVKPTRLAVDCAGRVYVLQEGQSSVVVLDAGGAFAGTVAAPETLQDRFCPVSVAIDAEGNLCLGDQFSRRLYVGAGSHCAGSIPVQSCGALAFDRSGNAILCDPQARRIMCLPPQAAYTPSGSYLSEPLDSRIYQCQWHQIRLKASVPAGTRLVVETLTAEGTKTTAEVALLPAARWAQLATTGAIEGEWDCLVQSPPGRYLWLRLTLQGDGTATPEIFWIEVHYPRRSSLNYLPAVYREDAVSAHFLDRFLAIFDSVRDSIVLQVATMARLFDADSTPAEAGADFLTWLAGWFDLALDSYLPVERRRLLLKMAWRLYELRGTPAGLRMHLALALGVEAHLLEHFKLRRWLYLGSAHLGDQTVWGAAVVRRLQLDVYSEIGQFVLIDSGDPLRDPFHHHAHQFTLFVALPHPTAEQRQAIQRIITAAKPAHTEAKLIWVAPRLRIGVQAFVGIDTMIGEYPHATVVGEGKSGYDTVLSSGDAGSPTNRIGAASRIGSSTVID